MTAKKTRYSEDDVNRGAAKKRLYKDKWYAFCIKSAETKTSESGHLMLITKNAPLTNPEDVNSVGGPAVRDNWVLPFDNEDVAEQEAPNTGGICIGKLRGIFGVEGKDGIPYNPRRDKDKKLRYKGEEIDPEKEMDARREVVSKGYKKLDALYENPTELIGHVFFGRVKHEGDFDNIDRYAFALPENADVATAEDFIDTGLEKTPEQKAGKSARRRGKAK